MPSDQADDRAAHGAPEPGPGPRAGRFPDDFAALAQTVGEHGGELLTMANVERIGVGYKVIGGIETHRRCVAVFVSRKIPESTLDPADIVPRRFHLHLTDVVESDNPPFP